LSLARCRNLVRQIAATLKPRSIAADTARLAAAQASSISPRALAGERDLGEIRLRLQIM
jgi:hypothetical protein